MLSDTNIINKNLNNLNIIKKELYFRVWCNQKLSEFYINLDINNNKFFDLLKDALNEKEYQMIFKFINESKE